MYTTCTIVHLLFSIHSVHTVEPQLSGPYLTGFSVNRTMEVTALLE